MTSDSQQFARSVAGLLHQNQPPFLVNLKEGISSSGNEIGILSVQEVLTKLVLPNFEFLDGSNIFDALNSYSHPPPRLISHSKTGNEITNKEKIESNESRLIWHDNSLCLSYEDGQIVSSPFRIEMMEMMNLNTAGNESTTIEWWNIFHKWLPGVDSNTGLSPILAKKIFLPSANSISIQIAWWGYQVFIPSAELKKLSQEITPHLNELATFSKILNTIISNLPSLILNEHSLMPAILLLRSLAPIVSTITSILLWGWQSIASLDNGNGIILAATWLIPVAILPRTWIPSRTVPVIPPVTHPAHLLEEAQIIQINPVTLPVNDTPAAGGTAFSEGFGPGTIKRSGGGNRKTGGCDFIMANEPDELHKTDPDVVPPISSALEPIVLTESIESNNFVESPDTITPVLPSTWNLELTTDSSTVPSRPHSPNTAEKFRKLFKIKKKE